MNFPSNSNFGEMTPSKMGPGPVVAKKYNHNVKSGALQLTRNPYNMFALLKFCEFVLPRWIVDACSVVSGNIYSKIIFKLWIKNVILWKIHKRYSYSERFSSVSCKRILPFTCFAIAIKYDQMMLQIVNTVIATQNEANKTLATPIWLNIYRQLQTRLYHVTQVVVSNCSIAPLT